MIEFEYHENNPEIVNDLCRFIKLNTLNLSEEDARKKIIKISPVIYERINNAIKRDEISLSQVNSFLTKLQSFHHSTLSKESEVHFLNSSTLDMDDNDYIPVLELIYPKDNSEIENESYNESYYLSYLTPEEIFNNYIANSSSKEANSFFSKLLTAHDIASPKLDIAKSFFNFIFDSLKHSQDHSNVTFNWTEFIDALAFNQSLKSFNRSFIDFKETDVSYFTEHLGLNKDQTLESIKEINSIIDIHNDITSTIISVFTLNEGVKQILLDSQKNFHPHQEDTETYNIIKNAIFKGEIPQEYQGQIQKRLRRSKQILSYIVEEQVIFHNIVQGLINKDSHQFFAGIDRYIKSYLNSEKISDNHTLTLNDIVILFTSDYFLTLQSSKPNSFSTLIELIFNHYDENIFKLFMEKYAVPKNIIIPLDQNIEDSKYLSLLEFSLFTNNLIVANSLVKLGFTLEPFNLKVIDRDRIVHYHYEPFKDISILSEDNLIYLIENGFINSNQLIDYFELTDEKVYVSNNIFFYLAYQQYNSAFFHLFNKSKLQDVNFTTKNLRTYYKVDLLSYYLLFSNQNNGGSFDTNIVSLLMSDDYVIQPNPSGLDLVHVLRQYDIDSLVDTVKYLSDVFPDSYKTAPAYQLKKSGYKTELIEWFDRKKLEKHLMSLDKERDAPNKEYIKNMLSNNNHLRSNLIIDNEGFFGNLQEQFPNFEEVIRFYKSQFRLKKLSGKTRITPVLLLGEPGIGKTYFAKKLAENLNTGYTFLDMASLTANWILTGNTATWKGAKQGKILESIMNSPTLNPIILMDELEKARSGEYDATLSLYQLLEEINAKSFTDEFVDFQFNASGIIYIACANTLGNLSEPLQTRFKIINVPKPNDEQIVSIIANIYHEATKDAHIFESHLDEQIVSILKKETLRSVKLMIDEAVGSALLEMNMQEMEKVAEKGEKISLTLKHFQAPIKKAPMGFSSRSN